MKNEALADVEPRVQATGRSQGEGPDYQQLSARRWTWMLLLLLNEFSANISDDTNLSLSPVTSLPDQKPGESCKFTEDTKHRHDLGRMNWPWTTWTPWTPAPTLRSCSDGTGCRYDLRKVQLFIRI